MIAFLKGKIISLKNNFVILETNNIGYKIFLSDKILSFIKKGDDAEFFIYSHIREDCFNLYGFPNQNELEFFELLLSISGIGPKSALASFSFADVKEYQASISNGDASLFNKVSGIGKKTAEKIIIELRDKINYIEEDIGTKSNLSYNNWGEEIEALIALGYSKMQAKEALDQVDKENNTSEDRIKEALRFLSK